MQFVSVAKHQRKSTRKCLLYWSVFSAIDWVCVLNLFVVVVVVVIVGVFFLTCWNYCDWFIGWWITTSIVSWIDTRLACIASIPSYGGGFDLCVCVRANVREFLSLLSHIRTNTLSRTQTHSSRLFTLFLYIYTSLYFCLTNPKFYLLYFCTLFHALLSITLLLSLLTFLSTFNLFPFFWCTYTSLYLSCFLSSISHKFHI